MARRRTKPGDDGELVATPIKHDELPAAAYSLELVTAICGRVAEGGLVSRICAESSMPATTTFYGWLNAHPQADLLYQAAKLARGAYCRDQIAEINELLSKGKIDPQSARVMSANFQWLASKDAPQHYSDRLEVTGAEGKDLIPEPPTDDLELARWILHVMGKADRQLAEQSGRPPILNGPGLCHDDGKNRA